ncbi:arginase family protein, partial [Bradyrhizobium sp. NBAIM08]|nr:arginase family protein [Bradyrhizobium sp. NBAIM08]
QPLRAALDEGWVRPEDVALVGARNLDAPEVEYMQAHGIDGNVARSLAGTTAVYVALDCDVLDPAAISCFMPEPGGPALVEVELGRSFVPFRFAGEADNILFNASESQQDEYLRPTIEGTRRSCFAITEPGAGSDARAIRTAARRDGDDWY